MEYYKMLWNEKKTTTTFFFATDTPTDAEYKRTSE